MYKTLTGSLAVLLIILSGIVLVRVVQPSPASPDKAEEPQVVVQPDNGSAEKEAGCNGDLAPPIYDFYTGNDRIFILKFSWCDQTQKLTILDEDSYEVLYTNDDITGYFQRDAILGFYDHLEVPGKVYFYYSYPDTDRSDENMIVFDLSSKQFSTPKIIEEVVNKDKGFFPSVSEYGDGKTIGVVLEDAVEVGSETLFMVDLENETRTIVETLPPEESFFVRYSSWYSDIESSIDVRENSIRYAVYKDETQYKNLIDELGHTRAEIRAGALIEYRNVKIQ